MNKILTITAHQPTTENDSFSYDYGEQHGIEGGKFRQQIIEVECEYNIKHEELDFLYEVLKLEECPRNNGWDVTIDDNVAIFIFYLENEDE